MLKTCLTCNKQYNIKASRAAKSKFCSLVCRYNHSIPAPETCPKCTKSFIPPKSNKNRIYCSRTCANSKPSKHKGRLLRPRYESTRVFFKPCKRCDQMMVLSNSKLRYSFRQWYCTDCRDNDKKLYRKECRFQLNKTDHAELFDGDLIRKYGWYQPASSKKPNLNGVTWDHLYQIQEGFANNIDPLIIRHPANAELVPFQENYNRRMSSTITLNMLYERIKNWH